MFCNTETLAFFLDKIYISTYDHHFTSQLADNTVYIFKALNYYRLLLSTVYCMQVWKQNLCFRHILKLFIVICRASTSTFDRIYETWKLACVLRKLLIASTYLFTYNFMIYMCVSQNYLWQIAPLPQFIEIFSCGYLE